MGFVVSKLRRGLISNPTKCSEYGEECFLFLVRGDLWRKSVLFQPFAALSDKPNGRLHLQSVQPGIGN